MYIKAKGTRIRQGDIFRDIEYIEDAFLTKDNRIGISCINFPYIIILSQDCDLESDNRARTKLTSTNNEISTDTVLESILVCPTYDRDLFVTGQHLVEIGLGNMAPWNTKKDPWDTLTKNCNPRYHYLKGRSTSCSSREPVQRTRRCCP